MSTTLFKLTERFFGHADKNNYLGSQKSHSLIQFLAVKIEDHRNLKLAAEKTLKKSGLRRWIKKLIDQNVLKTSTIGARNFSFVFG